jgi:TRAP-type mannitol/chloroaromatic compound transport system permease small subunit
MLIATKYIDALTHKFGLVAIYLVLFSSMVSAFNALLRYSLSGLQWLEDRLGSGLFSGVITIYRENSNMLSESQWYMFAGIVMFGAAWTLKVNEHVRVDLIYGAISERARTWIDLLGGIFFLLPMCILMIYFTWPWFMEAWTSGEGSPNSGGLVRWPVKLIVPIGFALVGLQGISEIIKCYLALTTNYVREYAYEKPIQ